MMLSHPFDEVVKLLDKIADLPTKGQLYSGKKRPGGYIIAAEVETLGPRKGQRERLPGRYFRNPLHGKRIQPTRVIPPFRPVQAILRSLPHSALARSRLAWEHYHLVPRSKGDHISAGSSYGKCSPTSLNRLPNCFSRRLEYFSNRIRMKECRPVVGYSNVSMTSVSP